MRPIMPDDPHSDLRATVQEAIGYTREVAPYFDGVARDLMQEFVVERPRSKPRDAYTGVNHSNAGRKQFFVGMAVWGEDGTVATPPADSEDRHMEAEEGFCNYGICERDLPLPLNDLLSSPRFAGNVVVDKFGARAYMGGWITIPGGLVTSSGYKVPKPVRIGSVWVVDTQVQDWTISHVDRIKHIADTVRDHIIDRDRS